MQIVFLTHESEEHGTNYVISDSFLIVFSGFHIHLFKLNNSFICYCDHISILHPFIFIIHIQII